MNLNNTKLPTYPRTIRLYLKRWREAQLERIRSIDVRDIDKIRVSQKNDKNGVYIFPELHVDGKWTSFRHSDDVLAAFVRSLNIGSEKRHRQLKDEWEEWLEDWMSENNLDIKFDVNKIKKVATATAAAKSPTKDMSKQIEALHDSGKGPNLIARLLKIDKRQVLRVLGRISVESQPSSNEDRVSDNIRDSPSLLLDS